MAKPPDMGEMMGAMGGMPKAGEEPAAPSMAEPEGTGEVSDEEMQHAKDMGFDATKAAALKRFIKACIADDAAGEYDENEPAEGADMGDL